jgi:hypothetical protein
MSRGAEKKAASKSKRALLWAAIAWALAQLFFFLVRYVFRAAPVQGSLAWCSLAALVCLQLVFIYLMVSAHGSTRGAGNVADGSTDLLGLAILTQVLAAFHWSGWLSAAPVTHSSRPSRDWRILAALAKSQLNLRRWQRKKSGKVRGSRAAETKHMY